MANGTQGGFDRLLSAASSTAQQKSRALAFEMQRRDAQERSQIANVNSLSGFNASALPKSMQEAMEQQIQDSKDYINGTGKYEGQEYSALEAANRINGLNNFFSKASAHNLGDVAEAKAQYKKSAGTIADDRTRINTPGDGSGMAVYENNSPSSYDAAVERHDNYFEYQRDPETNLIVIKDGEVQGYEYLENGELSTEPSDIFVMGEYANPRGFRPETIEEPIPRLLDLTTDPKLSNRFNRLKAASVDDAGFREMNARQQHDYVTGRLFDQYKGKDQESMEFRESMAEEIAASMGEGAFSREDLQNYIQGDFGAIEEENLGAIQNAAVQQYADYTYQQASTSTAFSGATVRGSGDETYNMNTLAEDQRIITEFSDQVESDGGYTIVEVGNDASGNETATIQYTNTTVDPVTGDETVSSSTRQVNLRDGSNLSSEIENNLRGRGLYQGLNQEYQRQHPELSPEALLAADQARRAQEDEVASGVLNQERQASVDRGVQEAQSNVAEGRGVDMTADAVTATEDADGTALTPVGALDEESQNAIATLQSLTPLVGGELAGRSYSPMADSDRDRIIQTLRNPNSTAQARANALASIDEQSEMRSGAEQRRNEFRGRLAEAREAGMLTQEDVDAVTASEQAAEVLGGMTQGAADLAQDVRENAASNLGRAGDAIGDALSGARESVGDAVERTEEAVDRGGRNLAYNIFGPQGPLQRISRGLRSFIGSGTEQIEERQRQALAAREATEAREAEVPTVAPEPAADVPDVTVPSGRGGAAPAPVPVRPEPESPAQERAEEAERERLETLETEAIPPYIEELQGLTPEMNLVSQFEGYANQGPRALRANVPRGEGNKPHSNSGYTIGGLDISVHKLDDLPFLRRILKEGDFEKIQQLEGLKGQEAQDKLNDLANEGLDANLSYLTPDDIKLIEAETYRTKVLPNMKKGLKKHEVSVDDFKGLPLEVRDAMNSVFFLSPSSSSPNTTKMLADAIKSGDKRDWEKLIRGLDRFWDRTGKKQEERVADPSDGIMQGHINRMQASAAQIAEHYDIPYTKS